MRQAGNFYKMSHTPFSPAQAWLLWHLSTVAFTETPLWQAKNTTCAFNITINLWTSAARPPPHTCCPLLPPHTCFPLLPPHTCCLLLPPHTCCLLLSSDTPSCSPRPISPLLVRVLSGLLSSGPLSLSVLFPARSSASQTLISSFRGSHCHSLSSSKAWNKVTKSSSRARQEPQAQRALWESPDTRLTELKSQQKWNLSSHF